MTAGNSKTKTIKLFAPERAGANIHMGSSTSLSSSKTRSTSSKNTKKQSGKKETTQAAGKVSAKQSSRAKKETPSKSTSKKVQEKRKNTSIDTNSTQLRSNKKSNSKNNAQTAAKSRRTSSKISTKKAKDRQKNNIKKKKNDIELEFPKTTWGVDSVVSFEATEHLPPPELTSIAGGFVFHEDKVILANIPGRGWEIIGGRIDIGESPEDIFKREAYNQIGVTLTHVKMIGVVRIKHEGPEPPNCPYPYPIGYGVQYVGIADELLPFTGGADSLGRSLVTPDGFKEHYFDWNEYYDAVFSYAYSVYQKLRKKLKK